MKMIDHNHFICHLILGTFTEYPKLDRKLLGCTSSLIRLFWFYYSNPLLFVVII